MKTNFNDFAPTDWFTLGLLILFVLSLLFVVYQLRPKKARYSRIDAALHYVGLCQKRRLGRKCHNQRNEHTVWSRF